VILLRVMIYNNLERWEEASIIGQGALRHYPDFGALYVATAYAVRHHNGAAEAKESLQRAFELDSSFKLRALDEPDLRALWESL
jgi:hypothetical protein